MIKTIFSLVLANLMILSLAAEEIQVFEDEVIDSDIHSVRIHQSDWELSWPYYELNSDSHLSLNFDDLSEDSRDFEYTIVHCNQNWEKSNLFYSDFIDGFERNPLNDYEMSVNTFIPYIHYDLKLPNDDVNFRVSGNYAVLVYDTENKDEPVFIKRFFVIEHEVTIDAEVRQPVLGMYRSLGQDVKFTLNTNVMEFNNLFEDIDVCIMQNYQWGSMQCDLQPDFVKNDEVVYNRDDQAVFKAISEYRRLSLRNLKFTNEKVAKIKYVKPNYFISLYPDKDNQFIQYSEYEDFNGRYAISNRDGWDSQTDADYVHVFFQVPARYNLIPSTVHVYGELTNWKCDKNSEMFYNSKNGMYEKELLLKQGVYAYRYVMKKDSSENHMHFEGSHWETENDYLIFVYYHDIRLGADRIIGFEVVNSRMKMSNNN
jgi:hypothetical protein